MSKKKTIGKTEVTIYEGGPEKALPEMEAKNHAQAKADAQGRFDLAMKTPPRKDVSREIGSWWPEVASGLLDVEAFCDAMRKRCGDESVVPLAKLVVRLDAFIKTKIELAKSGLTYAADFSIYGGTGKDAFLVSSPVKFIAEARDTTNNNWSLVVEVQDGDGIWHRISIPKTDVYKPGNPWVQPLAGRGLKLYSPSDFHRLLTGISIRNRERIVTKTGWYGDSFVLPDEVIGGVSGEAISFQGEEKHRLYQNGTLEEWRSEVGALCLGNSRLEFAVSAGFAAPLLTLVNMDGGGFNFFGESSIGKTISLRLSGSVWGGSPKEPYHRTFDNTAFAFEKLAEAHNDLLFGIDEGKQAKPEVLAKILYQIADGQGRGKGLNADEMRETRTWKTLPLTTAEAPMATLVEAKGVEKAYAGQQVRLIDIPADVGRGHGIFENLHGEVDGKAIADKLETATKTYYGTAGRAFLRCLISNLDDIRGKGRDAIADISRKLVAGKSASGQVHRGADRFALVAYGGEMAITAGVLPWPKGTALKAAKTSFDAWINHRGGAGQLEHEKGVEAAIKFLKTQRARFQILGPDGQTFPVHNRVGFISVVEGLYYVFPECWEEVCGSSNTAAVAGELYDRGYLIKESKSNSLQKRATVGELKKQRYYVLRFPDGKVHQPPRGVHRALLEYLEGWVDDEDNTEDTSCCPDQLLDA